MITSVFVWIGKAAVAALDAAIAVDAVIDKVKPYLRKRPKHEPSTPLTFKDVEHQRAQMRSATQKKKP